MLAVVLSLTGVIHFLIAVAVLAVLVLGLRWLFNKMGWALPEPLWAVLGFIVFLLLVLWVIEGGGTLTFR